MTRWVSFEMKGEIPVFSVTAYFEEECGRDLETSVDDLLRKGKTSVVIDFSRCPRVNSMGIGMLIEICAKVVNEFKGQVVLSGMTQMMQKVFRMAGVFSLAEEAETTESALGLLGKMS